MKYPAWTFEVEPWVLMIQRPESEGSRWLNLVGGLHIDEHGDFSKTRVAFDPDDADCMMMEQALLCAAMGAKPGKLIAVPFGIACLLHRNEEEIRILGGELINLRHAIENATLPCAEGDQQVPLRLGVVQAEEHEGGGSADFFELADGFEVVPSDYLARLEAAASAEAAAPPETA